ncbi:hypothetical protein AVEN_20908-1, partial [Araneus ventricosus]
MSKEKREDRGVKEAFITMRKLLSMKRFSTNDSQSASGNEIVQSTKAKNGRIGKNGEVLKFSTVVGVVSDFQM